ncbi:MAG TPA: diacylglycerol kinase family protein [Anaerolineaceae bacterium]
MVVDYLSSLLEGNPSENASDDENAHKNRAFLVLNPVSGILDTGFIRRRFEHHFARLGWDYAVYETTGKENLREIIHAELKNRPNFVVAAGGDGTISSVANGLVGTDTPLGIIPGGTGNLLARELQVPLETFFALNLLTGKHRIRKIDAMKVGDHYYILNLGVGMSSAVIKETVRKQKKRFGFLAYIWNTLKQLAGIQPIRFTVTADSQYSQFRAAEVMVSNGALIGMEPLRWDPEAVIDDGQVNMCVIRARNVLDFASIALSALFRRQRWNPHYRCITARRDITIQTEKPMLVEADGDIIGHTPVHISVIPQSLSVIVPETTNLLEQTLTSLGVIPPEGIKKFLQKPAK